MEQKSKTKFFGLWLRTLKFFQYVVYVLSKTSKNINLNQHLLALSPVNSWCTLSWYISWSTMETTMQTSRRPSKSRFHYQHIMCVPVRQDYTVISVVRCSIGRVGGRHRVTTAGLRKAHNLLRGLSHRECLVLSADIAPMWPACSLHHNITNPYYLGNEFLCKKTVY